MYIVPLALIDLVARLAVPASLFALARGYGDAAIAAAVAVNALSVGRGLLSGKATEAVLQRRWTELVAAARRYDVARLRARDDMHSVVALLDAVIQQAQFEATTLPQLVANGLGLLVTLLAVVMVLGVGWLLLGALAVALASPVVLLGHRQLRRAQGRSFERFNDAAAGFEVLLEGATELRVHGVESRHASHLLDHIRAMASAERSAKTTSVLLGLLPVGVALLASVIPLRAGVHHLDAPSARLAEIGILGATALAIAMGLLSNLESFARSIPFRTTVGRFVRDAPAPRREGSRVIDFAHAEVRLEGVSFRYRDSVAGTPHDVSTSWGPNEGLALSGNNGAGKTTLALCLIGLLDPTEGRIVWDDVPSAEVDWSALRSRIVYVPQQGYVAGHQSILWHLELLAAEAISLEAVERALREVGLWEVLAQRDPEPWRVPVAQLSGGERKRMHLARALLGEPELIVLDEPEAGLDAASRRWLQTWIASLARRRRVLIIAHDDAVIPPGFRSVACDRSREETGADQH